MTHPMILEAVAAARRDDLMRSAAARSGGRVIRRRRRARHAALRDWLRAQLRRPGRRPASDARCAATS